LPSFAHIADHYFPPARFFAPGLKAKERGAVVAGSARGLPFAAIFFFA
jgi:hypothetical protein